MPTLLEKLGGDPAIDAAVNLFYKKVLGDKDLMPFFEGKNTDQIRNHQKIFMTAAFGGKEDLTAFIERLKQVHRPLIKLGLEEKHFDKVILHLKAALAELEVKENLIREAAEIAESLRPIILNK